jgi:predicted GIY-YIG superfamily endonuclease
LGIAFHAYLLRRIDGSFYVGYFDNLESRSAQHEQSSIGGYTTMRRPLSLVWTESFETRDEALAAER